MSKLMFFSGITRGIGLAGAAVLAAGGLGAIAQQTSAAPAAAATASVRAAFYYPWFPESWSQNGINPYTKYHPTAGTYDSGSASVIAKHIAQMEYGNIRVGIASWWGQNTPTDSRVPALLAGASGHNFKWTLYYEPEGLGDPSSATINSDLSYIKSKYAGNTSYYTRNGKPVLFVYDSGPSGCSTLARWHAAAAAAGFYVVQKVFAGYTGCAYQPDSWHQYGPAAATDHQSGFSYTVSPGFYKAGESTPRLARNLTTFTSNVKAMVASGEPWNLITTFNEWGEGTSVEPATEWASSSGYGTYLDVLHANNGVTTSPSPMPTPSANSSPSPSPSPTPTASSSPSPTPTSTPSPGAPCVGGAVPTWQHVVWIVMENHDYTSVIGSSSSPYVNSLVASCGLATNYHAVTRPSLPNYLAMTGGSTFGVTDDAAPSSHPIGAQSIFGQVDSRSLQESMPSNCLLSNSGLYAVKHNPHAYFTPVRTQCQTRNVPLTSTPDISAAFTFVTPNLCSDTHDCSVSQGDTFLKGLVPKLLASAQYKSGNTAIVITWDENGGQSGNQVATVILAPSVRSGTKDATSYTHYSLLRTTEEMLRAPLLAAAGSATSMGSGMHLR